MNTKFKQHLFERQISITYRHVWLDDENEILTFPLWNLSGQLVGYQQYNWKSTKDKRNKTDGRYWTYTTAKSLGVFGMLLQFRTLEEIALPS